LHHSINIAELIGSRICHDLISPIGAINNGLELMEMSTPSSSPEMALISDSVSNASARIRFFRIAFGAAGAQLVGRPEVISILKDVYSDTRLTVNWGPLAGVPRCNVRMAFLALQCLETGMPYGGRIDVTQEGEQIVLTGHADKLKIDVTLWDMLKGEPRETELHAAQVQFGLLPQIAEDESRSIKTEIIDSCITIRI
jgi:histidine phosphotransferase ChpT